MKIIAGLGNPGERYRSTRHNAGYMVVDLLAQKHGVALKRKAFGGVCGVGKVLGKELALFEPHTYMNLSGEAVKALCSSKLCNKADLLVICDDVNLDLGLIRLRRDGSSGGHNGLGSVIQHIGPEFARLKIGVGRKAPFSDMKNYVLSDFSAQEVPLIEKAVQKAVLCVEEWLLSGIERAMALYNSNMEKEIRSSKDSEKNAGNPEDSL